MIRNTNGGLGVGLGYQMTFCFVYVDEIRR